MDFLPIIIVAVIAVVGVGAATFFLGIAYRKNISEKITGSAEVQATKIIDDAKKEAASSKKVALVEAKEEIQKNRHEMEREIRDRRNEMTRQERRLQQKEESLDKKNGRP